MEDPREVHDLANELAKTMYAYMSRTLNNLMAAYVKTVLAHLITSAPAEETMEAKFARFQNYPYVRDNVSLFDNLNLEIFARLHGEVLEALSEYTDATHKN
jgi:hypothetical protein